MRSRCFECSIWKSSDAAGGESSPLPFCSTGRVSHGGTQTSRRENRPPAEISSRAASVPGGSASVSAVWVLLALVWVLLTLVRVLAYAREGSCLCS